MRIAQISTLARPVPPNGEGSVETLVHGLTEGLIRRGHEVTLFAVAASQTSAHLCSPVETSYAADPRKWDWQLYEAYQVSQAFRDAARFDLIHCHAYSYGFLFCDSVATPSLHSLHIEPGHDTRFLATRTRNRWIHFSSKFQAREFADVPRVHIIPHGIELAQYRVAGPDDRENYLLFLGRFIPEKGPLEAIDIARRAGVPLKLAAPENDYFREILRPQIDGKQIRYIGEVAGDTKRELLTRARALIYPIRDPEPFGLVLLEALASGLPILAFNRGSVSEIVTPGRTGFVGQTGSDLIEQLDSVDSLDRQEIRRDAEERFSHETMLDRLEQLMSHIVAEAKS